MARRAGDAISYQVSVRGKGISAMNNSAMRVLLNKHVSGQELPPGIEVSVTCWRAGRELDMKSDNSRAETLRKTFLVFLQAGRIQLSFGDDQENSRSI